MGARIGLSLGLLAYLLVLSTAVAQNPDIQLGGKPTPISDELRARGIDTSESSLISALRNKDESVRSMAALQLAEDHHYDAISSIEAALMVESVPKTRISMLEALWGLGDPKGLPSLQSMCSDPSLSIYDLIVVVEHLTDIGASSRVCAIPIIRYRDSHGHSSEANQMVVAVLPDLYKWAPPDQAQWIVNALQEMLTDKDASVRMEASHGLVRVKSRSSLDLMHAAASREADPEIRSSLESDMSNLEKDQ